MKLNDQLCFALYATSIAITRTYKPMLDAMGLTYPQYLVLTVLNEHDGTTIGGIAERLTLKSSTITPPVKRLEQAGLVNRQRSATDERLVQVWLTQAGRTRVIDADCLGTTLTERSGLTPAALKKLGKQVQALQHTLVMHR